MLQKRHNSSFYLLAYYIKFTDMKHVSNNYLRYHN